MRTLLPLDPAVASYRLAIDPPLSDAELEEFCRLNDVIRVERTREGVLRMNPPAGFSLSSGNADLGAQLYSWWKTHRRGRVGDSSAGFYLPDGSMLSPDACYLTEETLARTTREDFDGFPHVCPDFVIELLSKTGRLKDAKGKMELWIENGGRLGWLVNPDKRNVLVYEAGTTDPKTVTGDWVEGAGPVAGFRLNLGEVWDCY